MYGILVCLRSGQVGSFENATNTQLLNYNCPEAEGNAGRAP